MAKITVNRTVKREFICEFDSDKGKMYLIVGTKNECVSGVSYSKSALGNRRRISAEKVFELAISYPDDFTELINEMRRQMSPEILEHIMERSI